MSIPITADNGIDVSFNPIPEYPRSVQNFAAIGSIGTGRRLLGFVADVPYEIMHLSGSPRTISSGTMTIDCLLNGVSILTSFASATVANTPVPAVFASTRINKGDLVVVQTDTNSATSTDVTGIFIIRPLYGHERNQ